MQPLVRCRTSFVAGVCRTRRAVSPHGVGSRRRALHLPVFRRAGPAGFGLLFQTRRRRRVFGRRTFSSSSPPSRSDRISTTKTHPRALPHCHLEPCAPARCAVLHIFAEERSDRCCVALFGDGDNITTLMRYYRAAALLLIAASDALQAPAARRPARTRRHSATLPDEPHRVEIAQGAGREPLVLETGRIGRQADAAITATRGGTTVYATLCVGAADAGGGDFLPMSVEYTDRAESRPTGPDFAIYVKRDDASSPTLQNERERRSYGRDWVQRPQVPRTVLGDGADVGLVQQARRPRERRRDPHVPVDRSAAPADRAGRLHRGRAAPRVGPELRRRARPSSLSGPGLRGRVAHELRADARSGRRGALRRTFAARTFL